MNTNDNKLSELLRTARVSPVLPPRFQENVWRRIGDAEFAPVTLSWLDALAALVLKPRIVIGATITLIFLGVFAGAFEGRQLARHDAQVNYLASVAPHPVR